MENCKAATPTKRYLAGAAEKRYNMEWYYNFHSEPNSIEGQTALGRSSKRIVDANSSSTKSSLAESLPLRSK
jgi:hypothetical protein